MLDLKARLVSQLREFEKQYRLISKEFYARYEKGELGDDMDFVEWAATVEMVANADRRLTLLNLESIS